MTMKKTRLLSLFIALTMLLSAACFPASAEGAKYTTEETKEGWIKVTQDGGPTLGYSPDSGVTLLEDDGYAFKDLNKNGSLDVYEDWRLDADTRAADLVAQMSMDEKLPLMLLKEYDMEYSKGEIDTVTWELDNGMRALCVPFDLGSVRYAIKYVNGIQAYTEALAYGIPVEICAETGLGLASEWPGHLALAATFDPSIAAEYAEAMSEEYRALGISGMMAPQTDLATEPRWSRITGTFGEDPQLATDIVTAYVNALQSTYDDEGNDLGWGSESIITQVKHFPGDGAAEGGREAHSSTGAYNVYPGDNFYTHLLPFQGTLELPGKTGSAAGVMPSYSIAIDEDGEPYDDEAVASGFSYFKLTEVLREEMGFDGVITSDFVITQDGGRVWGTEDLTVAERKLLSIEAGMDRFGGESDVEGMKAAYDLGVAKYGEEAMNERIDASVFRLMRNVFRVGLFENAYTEEEYIDEVVKTDEKTAAGYAAMQKSVVMLKNSAGLIKSRDEKPTVYIPMVFTAGTAGSESSAGTAASASLPVDQRTASKYFNVVTDTIADVYTGPADADGNPTMAEADIIRASADEIAACDFTLVFVSSPSSDGYDSTTGKYIPISLQYGEYVADSEYVRDPSLGGDEVEIVIESPYGAQTTYETENRSYYGEKAVVSNASDLDQIKYAASVSDNVIVVIAASKPMVFNEFEADVEGIVMYFSGGNIGGTDDSMISAVLDIVSGKVEPSGLLPLQMPANMETVEAQYEDVPRDMECHVDSEGNVYDFAYGMDWDGVIDDERVQKYSVEPLEG